MIAQDVDEAFVVYYVLLVNILNNYALFIFITGSRIYFGKVPQIRFIKQHIMNCFIEIFKSLFHSSV